MSDRLALFGGTFNPIHRGHVTVGRAAIERLELGRLVLVPSGSPPHKRPANLAPGADRLAMCRLAVADDPRIVVSDVELRSSQPSYTVTTLSTFHAEHPEAELLLLVGADMVRDFHKWRRHEEVARLARIVTLPRPGVELGELSELRRSLGDAAVDRLLADVLDTPRVEVSSTEVRRRVAAGEPIDDLVPAAVARYIAEHGLYGGAGEPGKRQSM